MDFFKVEILNKKFPENDLSGGIFVLYIEQKAINSFVDACYHNSIRIRIMGVEDLIYDIPEPVLESDCNSNNDIRTMKYKINDYCMLRGLQGVCKVAGINGNKYDLLVMGKIDGKMYDDGGCRAHLWGIEEENLRDYKEEN